MLGDQPLHREASGPVTSPAGRPSPCCTAQSASAALADVYKVILCPECAHCPEVEITDQGVTIGENTNTVRLSHAEWNELARLIKCGTLHEV